MSDRDTAAFEAEQGGSRQAVSTPTMHVDEWRARAKAIGAGDWLDAPFVCPACGNVATPRSFRAMGTEPARALTECIGRVSGAGSARGGRKKKRSKPCDWAAGGLLGTLNGGVVVVTEDGKHINVFAFADDGPNPAPVATAGEGGSR